MCMVGGRKGEYRAAGVIELKYPQSGAGDSAAHRCYSPRVGNRFYGVV